MMRLNATLPALLALAVLFLIPATLLAKPAHHRARKSTTVHRQVDRKATATHERSAKPHVSHVRSSHSRTRHHSVETVRTKARRSTPRDLSVSDQQPRKATSDDFLKAASVKQVKQDVHEAPASHHTERAAVVTHSRRSSRRSRSSARPVSVVSVIRPAPEKPQLKSITEEAASPAILPVLYNKRGRLIVPPPLKGTHEILLHQNEVADREGLERIQNDADLMDMS